MQNHDHVIDDKIAWHEAKVKLYEAKIKLFEAQIQYHTDRQIELKKIVQVLNPNVELIR